MHDVVMPPALFLKKDPGRLEWPEQLALPSGTEHVYFTHSWLSFQRPLLAAALTSSSGEAQSGRLKMPTSHSLPCQHLVPTKRSALWELTSRGGRLPPSLSTCCTLLQVQREVHPVTSQNIFHQKPTPGVNTDMKKMVSWEPCLEKASLGEYSPCRASQPS